MTSNPMELNDVAIIEMLKVTVTSTKGPKGTASRTTTPGPDSAITETGAGMTTGGSMDAITGTGSVMSLASTMLGTTEASPTGKGVSGRMATASGSCVGKSTGTSTGTCTVTVIDAGSNTSTGPTTCTGTGTTIGTTTAGTTTGTTTGTAAGTVSGTTTGTTAGTATGTVSGTTTGMTTTGTITGTGTGTGTIPGIPTGNNKVTRGPKSSTTETEVSSRATKGSRGAQANGESFSPISSRSVGDLTSSGKVNLANARTPVRRETKSKKLKPEVSRDEIYLFGSHPKRVFHSNVPLPKIVTYFEVTLLSDSPCPWSVGLSMHLNTDKKNQTLKENVYCFGSKGNLVLDGQEWTSRSLDKGDTIGIFLNPIQNTLFFTRNGLILGEEVHGVYEETYSATVVIEESEHSPRLRCTFGPHTKFIFRVRQFCKSVGLPIANQVVQGEEGMKELAEQFWKQEVKSIIEPRFCKCLFPSELDPSYNLLQSIDTALLIGRLQKLSGVIFSARVNQHKRSESLELRKADIQSLESKISHMGIVDYAEALTILLSIEEVQQKQKHVNHDLTRDLERLEEANLKMTKSLRLTAKPNVTAFYWWSKIWFEMAMCLEDKVDRLHRLQEAKRKLDMIDTGDGTTEEEDTESIWMKVLFLEAKIFMEEACCLDDMDDDTPQSSAILNIRTVIANYPELVSRELKAIKFKMKVVRSLDAANRLYSITQIINKAYDSINKPYLKIISILIHYVQLQIKLEAPSKIKNDSKQLEINVNEPSLKVVSSTNKVGELAFLRSKQLSFLISNFSTAIDWNREKVLNHFMSKFNESLDMTFLLVILFCSSKNKKVLLLLVEIFSSVDVHLKITNATASFISLLKTLNDLPSAITDHTNKIYEVYQLRQFPVHKVIKAPSVKAVDTMVHEMVPSEQEAALDIWVNSLIESPFWSWMGVESNTLRWWTKRIFNFAKLCLARIYVKRTEEGDVAAVAIWQLPLGKKGIHVPHRLPFCLISNSKRIQRKNLTS
eukprot:TRINITY_DN8426_c0_g1_i7.p1 TRINITY_DN8426_c0_g1~~TRINITY_DN8426_c0_g1_i7.p1  ORF type:complete len:1072 (-),score=219.37 TRINITY_DN8426_c0_g1_i7:44-3061(-)